MCTNYEAKEIYEILNGNNEDNYFAKILLYFHNIFQYEFILKKLNKFKKEDEFVYFVNEIKDLNLKKKIEKDLENLDYYRI